MRAIVCGSRSASDAAFVFTKLDELRDTRGLSFVIEGGQRNYRGGNIVGGVDWHARQWAEVRNVPYVTVTAIWHDLSHPNAKLKIGPSGKQYDANAGPRRNLRMLTDFYPDVVIAFPGGRGTDSMKRLAVQHNVSVIEVKP